MASHHRLPISSCFTRRARSTFSVLCCALVLLVSAPFARRVSAQGSSEKAAAEALFDRGLALMREGNYKEACERLEQSQSIERGIGTMLYLAECYEKVGKTAAAWALFREASSTAQAAGQTERADAGKRRAERLEKSLSRLTLQVPSSSRVQGLQISDNGTPVHVSVWNVGVPVDPGSHRIDASAPGYKPWSKEVNVDPNGASAEVAVPALEVDENAKVAAAVTPAAAAGTVEGDGSNPPPAARSERMSNVRIAGLAVGGAGVVAIIVGAGFGIRAMNLNDSAQDKCGKDVNCASERGVNAAKDAKSAANVSTAMWAVGGTLVAGGIVTFLLGPKHQPRADVAFRLDRQTAALQVGGVF